MIIITDDTDLYCYMIKLSYSSLVYILFRDTMITPDHSCSVTLSATQVDELG